MRPIVFRLCVDFRTPEDLLAWFEEAREAGVFGYDRKDWGDDLVTDEPKKAIGVRELDYVDDMRPVHAFKVSGTKDGGSFLTTETIPEIVKAVLVQADGL